MNYTAQFKAMLLAEAGSKYPNVPEQHLSIKEYKTTTANGLTQAIIKYIQLIGGQAERISTTGQYREGKTWKDSVGFIHTMPGKWCKGTTTKGSADISATIKGRSFKIEVKIKDRQSEAQKNYQHQIELAGGVYLISRNFEQACEDINYFINLAK